MATRERGPRYKTFWSPTSEGPSRCWPRCWRKVNAFLGRHRYQRGRTFRGYRNGYHPARELTVGLGPVAVRVSQASITA